jgi:hypothetical protein
VSSSGSSSVRWIVVAGVWLVLVGAAVGAYKLFFAPRRQAELVTQTSGDPGDSPATDRVRLAQDSFSGYAIFRSEALRQELSARGLGLEVVDDRADYAARIRALRSGEAPLAVFTIDALVKASAELGELPGTIVLVLDETVGADAMVAYQQAVPNLDALNRPDARIVATPDSPSETLARVVMARFRLPELPADPFLPADGAADALRQFREASPSDPRAFVLWEPHVSQALTVPGAHVVVDSSQMPGSIVDVLVCERQYLLEHAATVRKLIEGYLRVRYDRQQQADGLVKLVRADAEQAGEPLTAAQAEKLVHGIWWKNTQENYAHFGVVSGAEAGGLPHIRDLVRNITEVLLRTGAIAADPTDGHPEKLYFDQILREMHQPPGGGAPFHPSVVAAPGAAEEVRAAAAARPLKDNEWQSLRAVGEAGVEPLVFARGTARLLASSEQELARLAETLKAWPHFYVQVRGHTLARGDPEKNRLLSEQRAQAAADYLIAQGIAAHRIRAEGVPPDADGEEASAVKFVLGQLPY